MAESFENLDILRDWAKDEVQKKSCGGIEQVREAFSSQKEKDKAVSVLENDSKNTRAVSVGSRVRLNQTQNWSW